MIQKKKHHYSRWFLVALTVMSLRCASSDALRSVPEERKKTLLFQGFRNASIDGSRYDPWRLGLPDMLTDDFVQSGMFRVVSEDARHRALNEMALQQSGMTDQQAIDLGHVLGAEWILAGDFQVFEGQLSVNARVIDVSSTRILASSHRQGKLSEFFQLSKDVSVALLQQFHVDLTSQEIAVLRQRVDTRSVEASLNNYSGEALVAEIDALKARRSQKGTDRMAVDQRIKELQAEARKSFQSAIDHDSSYERSRKNLSKLSLMLPSSI